MSERESSSRPLARKECRVGKVSIFSHFSRAEGWVGMMCGAAGFASRRLGNVKYMSMDGHGRIVKVLWKLNENNLI